MRSENRMSVRRSLIPLALALFAARCSDQVGPHPTAIQQSLAQTPHFLQWAGPVAPQFSAMNARSGHGGHPGLQASAPGGLSLHQYTATFWAVRGEPRSVQINYLSSTGDTSSAFLRLAGVDPAYVPGRGDLVPGDSVLITVTIDPYDIKVSLEPTGLLFDNPAELQISYGGADGDLNGDGVVDGTDASIESQLLGMWYREGADNAWTQIPAAQSLSGKSFSSALRHFSEYAVSW
jgi:hypothetical protein